jgi:hypothetical protein
MREGEALQPLLPLEKHIRQHRGEQHRDQRVRVAVLPFQFRHRLEIHAVDRRDQGRRHQHHRHHREQLDDVVLFEVDDAEHGVEHEGDLVGEVAGVVGQRGDVALHGFQLLAHVLGPFDALGAGGDEGHHPADRDQALTHLGGEIALAADCDQDVGIALGVAGARGALGLENVVADIVHVAAGALQDVGVAVDHGIQKLHQHHFARDAGGAGAGQLVLHQHERFRLVIAHGDQAVAGEDKGHRGGARIFGVGRAHQRRRHVTRGILDIETARNLDFLHVLPGRHRDPGQPLHRLVLGRGRFYEIDPDRALRQRGQIVDANLFQGEFGRDEHR